MEYRGQSNFGSKNYLIGLGGRGITALEAFGVWEDVKNASVMVPGRMDWTPGSSEPMESMLNERKYSAHVLSLLCSSIAMVVVMSAVGNISGVGSCALRHGSLC